MVEIIINSDKFPYPWEVSTTLDGQNKMEAWVTEKIENGYEEDEEDITAYPFVNVIVNLPQDVIIGVAYGSRFHFGDAGNKIWVALWYCAPRLEKFFEFVEGLRIAEQNYVYGTGVFSIAGNEREEVD